MHDRPKGADDECAGTNAAEDDREQSAVLRQVLEVHPTELTQDELIREMNGGRPREFSEMDRVQRAIRELAGTGLLHRPGEDEIVRPTRAAVRYSELTGGAVWWRSATQIKNCSTLSSTHCGDACCGAIWNRRRG